MPAFALNESMKSAVEITQSLADVDIDLVDRSRSAIKLMVDTQGLDYLKQELERKLDRLLPDSTVLTTICG